MNGPPNLVSVRVWGDFACFTRPEMKVERVSYPICTPSAARGILEAIFWEPEMYYVIDTISVIKRGRWFSFQRNEVTKVIEIKKACNWMDGEGIDYITAGAGADDAAQRNMLALADVDYIVTAEVRLTPRHHPGRDSLAKYLSEIRRRAGKGKCFHRPAFGCREFTVNFELAEEDAGLRIDVNFNENLGLILYDIFDPDHRARATAQEPYSKPNPVFFLANVDKGMMDCHPSRVRLVRPGFRRGEICS